MKKKALTATLCLAVAATTVFASCSAGNTQLQFASNWFSDTSASAEMSDLDSETLEYGITFSAGNGMNEGKYDIKYCVDESGAAKAGSYTTVLTHQKTAEPPAYTLTATCEIPVLYTYKGESKHFVNKMESTVVFMKANSKLQPLSSKKKVTSYSPSIGSVDSIDDCYTLYDYSAEIVYNEDGGSAKSITVTDNQGNFWKKDAPDSFSIDRSKYTYLDNEQLFFALRGLSNSAMKTTSYVNSYNLSLRRVCNLVLSAKEQGNTTDFKDTLIGGTPVGADTPIPYNAVTLALNEKNQGPAMEIWYAQKVDVAANTYRNVMLKLKENLAYNMGSLVYTLKSASFI